MKPITYLYAAAMILLMTQSCTKDLNRRSETSTSPDELYSSEGGYRAGLAKIYAGLAITGNAGPDGAPDIVGAGSGVGEGFQSYLRNFFNLQEFPTEEALTAWNDNTLRNFHFMNWTATDIYCGILYSRIYYQITLSNSFLKEATDEKMAARGITGADADKVKQYRAEARFLRALSYFHAMDMFGNPSFVTEEDPIGTQFLPTQISRAGLYSFIENECLDIEDMLLPPRAEYGRADKAANWMLLATLYLNAKVYTGIEKNNEALTYAAKVINEGGYALQADYPSLFNADNDQSPEIIFPIEFDCERTKTWGGTTYLAYTSIGGNMNPADYGMSGGWWSMRSTKTLVEKFSAKDKRGAFFTTGQNIEINDVGNFFEGYPVIKWINKHNDGSAVTNNSFSSIDFPVYRLAEAYLIYAEAVLRGADGSQSLALAYINQLRGRAEEDSLSSMNLDIILDERARELHHEAKRRTDLIRFGKFTSADYVWPWKGNVKEGKGVESFRIIYPIPSAEINSNSNLVQNEGY